MKKKKLLRAMSLADEKYVEEADPDKNLSSNEKVQKKIKISNTKKWTAIAASVLLAVTVLNLFLFIPYRNTPPSVEKYSGSEYYHIIKKLNEITFQKNAYKNNFEMLYASFENLDFGSKDFAAGDAAPNSPAPTDPGEKYEEITDNQVAGVVEADRIKRSDKYIYYLWNSVLRVYSIAGEETALAGEYLIESLDRGYYNRWEFYLSEDCDTITMVAPGYDTERGACVTLVSLDVTDPANITEKGRISVTGGYISTRVADGKLLLMTNFRVSLKDGRPDFSDEYSFLPSINKGNGFELIPVDDIITPENLTSPRYTVVCMVDENTLAFEDATALLSYSENVYVSKDKIFATHSYTVNKDSAKGGYTESFSATEISAISYSGGEMKLLGSTMVEGYVKDQYSLDEYDGVLRVVTTTDRSFYVKDTNAEDFGKLTSAEVGTSADLYCISLESYEIISSVIGFAPRGETVRSVRFDGTDAYVCTAIELKDPVFFFDLTDINNITYKETGTIEGFSTSLVNFGNGYLLGIGVGGSGGLKIEVYEETEGGVVSVCAYEIQNSSYSENYKSYYIDRKNQLVGLGVDIYAYDKYSSGTPGKYILVSFDGYEIHELIRVDLSGNNEFKRGVYIDGYMYMFSEDEFAVKAVN